MDPCETCGYGPLRGMREIFEKDWSTSIDSIPGAYTHCPSIGDACVWKRWSQKGIRESPRELNGEYATVGGRRVRRRATACARHEDEGCQDWLHIVLIHPLPARLCANADDDNNNNKAMQRALQHELKPHLQMHAGE